MKKNLWVILNAEPAQLAESEQNAAKTLIICKEANIFCEALFIATSETDYKIDSYFTPCRIKDEDIESFIKTFCEKNMSEASLSSSVLADVNTLLEKHERMLGHEIMYSTTDFPYDSPEDTDDADITSPKSELHKQIKFQSKKHLHMKVLQLFYS